MKISFLFFLMTSYSQLQAQKIEAYYDHAWKECSPEEGRYFGVLEKTDSGWFRKDFFINTRSIQMQALYEDKACKIPNGTCTYYYSNGRVSSTGRMVQGQREGVHLRFHSNGMLADSAAYQKGKIMDKRYRWHRNGWLSDSIARINDSTEANVGWFDDGSLSYAGLLVNTEPHAKWKYYHYNGQLAALIIYDKGKKLSSSYFDEKGDPLKDTSAVNREANFKGSETAWRRYLEKNLTWPRGLEFSTTASITVMISFVVDENGKTTDVEVSLPFYPEFDKLAVKLIENSPPWNPAIYNNRKVKAWRLQPVTFVQTE